MNFSKRRTLLRRGLAGTALSLFAASSALALQSAQEDVLSGQDHSLLRQRLETHELDLERIQLPDDLPDLLTVEVTIDGRPVTLRLHKQSVRTDDFKIYVEHETGEVTEMEPPPVRTYRLLDVRGLEAQPDTIRGWGSLVDGGLEAGLDWNDGMERSIEIAPVRQILRRDDIAPDLHAVVDDRHSAPSRVACGTQGVSPVTPPDSDNTYNFTTAVGTVAAIIDDCFVQWHSGSQSARINAAIASTEAIHAAENTAYGVGAIDIHHAVAGLVIQLGTPTNCGTALIDSQTTLNNLGTTWNNQYAALFPQVGNVQLFTGRPFTDSPVIGRAWLAGWCNLSRNYGVNHVTYYFSNGNRAKLVAHERGHNWNASHCSGGNCDIMNATLISTGQVGAFGTQATNQINGYKAGLPCLNIGTFQSPQFLESFTSATINTQRWDYDLNANLAPNPLNGSDMMVAMTNPTGVTLPLAAELRTINLDFLPAIPFMTNLKIEFEAYDPVPTPGSSLVVQYKDRSGIWQDLPYLSTTNLVNNTVSTPFEVAVPWDELHYGDFRIRFQARNLGAGETIYVDDIWVKYESEVDHTINAGTFMASGDLNNDGQDDLVIGNPNLNNIFGGVSVHLSGSATAAGSFTGTTTFEGLGSAMAVVGDLNGDGFNELAVGGSGLTNTPTNGVVRVFSGAGFASTPAVWTPLFGGPLTGANLEQFGAAITGLGDVDGDGTPDLAIGAPRANNEAGAVYIHSGATGARITSATLAGEVAGDRFGGTLDWVERADAQVEPDLVVGMRYLSFGAGSQRPAYVKVFSGSLVGGTLPLIKRIADTGVLNRLAGAVGDPQFGYEVCGLGDFDADGWSDVAIGIIGTRQAFTNGPVQAGGHVWVLSSASGPPTDVLMQGEAYAGYFGLSMERAGDLNKDGFDDFVVGAGYLDRFTPAGGAVYAMVGPSGTQAGRYYRVDYGMTASHALGYNVSAGDYDGDGFGDFTASTNRGCTSSTTCPNTTTVYSGYRHSGTYTPISRGSLLPGTTLPPSMVGIMNNFSGGATIEISDIPTGGVPFLVIGNTITTTFSNLGADYLVVPTVSVQIAPDANGRFTWSFVPPTGGGQLYHQVIMLTATNLGASNIIERIY